MSKDNIQEKLLVTGRQIVQMQGVNALTARKLSDASGFSVGTIYNQFGNMDNFILIQNYLTLEELFNALAQVDAPDGYQKINAYADVFARFVLENRNFWFLLFNFHLNQSSRTYSRTYLRLVSNILMLVEKEFAILYPKMKSEKRSIGTQVLWITLFSLSALLTTDAINTYSKLEPTKVVKFLLGTYLTGLKVLN